MEVPWRGVSSNILALMAVAGSGWLTMRGLFFESLRKRREAMDGVDGLSE